MRDARCVSLIPRTTLHSDSEHCRSGGMISCCSLLKWMYDALLYVTGVEYDDLLYSAGVGFYELLTLQPWRYGELLYSAGVEV